MVLGTQNVIPPSQVIQSRKLGSPSGTGSNFLSYPSNLGVHYMLMNFKEYNRYNNQSSTTTTKYSIALPVPDNMKEEHMTGWSESKLGWVGAAIENRDSVLPDYNTNQDSYYQSFIKTLPYAEQILRQALRRTELGEAVEQLSGQIVNPHQVTNFTGVILREHSFYWTFTPENQNDSNTIRSIFNQIRIAMLPASQNNSRLLLQYPYEVDISIGGTDDANRPIFKSCVIVGLTLDGQIEGQSYFRNGGAYTAMKMTMHLKETEAFTRDDVQYLLNNPAGSAVASPSNYPQSQNGMGST